MTFSVQRIAVAIAAAAIFGLVGCAGDGLKSLSFVPLLKKPKPCPTGKKCELKVIVKHCNPGGISVEPIDSVEVLPGEKDVQISWEIDGKDYEFGSNGIDFYGIDTNSPNSEFTLKSHGPDKIEFENKHMKAPPAGKTYIDYPYGVNVRVAGRGVACAVFDPFVRNSF